MIASALLAVALIGLAAGLVARATSTARLRTVRQLEQISAYGYVEPEVILPERAQRSLAERLGALIAPMLGRARVRAIRKQLVSAGLHSTTPETYIGYYALAVAATPLVLLWFATSTRATGGLALVEVAMGLGMGLLIPRTVVSRRGRLRLERIDREMPELVDLLLVGVESGVGLNGAIRLASKRVEGPLGEELRLTIQQQGLGASTTESLENLLERSDTPALRSFVRTIVQGDALGVSIGQMMRALADEMRKHRKMLAEERAQKTSVKILFPLVVCLLPAMVAVLMMPAIYNLLRALGNA